MNSGIGQRTALISMRRVRDHSVEDFLDMSEFMVSFTLVFNNITLSISFI
jgi:hypothetical protein